ncbi:MAG: tRNA lysidine(34) synthetase TilS [Candidatus Fimenecus sp.]
MRNAVLSCVREYAMFRDGDRVTVGFSGGADSCCLLHLLFTLQEELHIQVSALHIHHGIRGAEADRDAAFCKAFCEKFGIPFAVSYVHVPQTAAQSRETTEECARRLRYAALQNAAGEQGKIATAHTADDNAETVLWNLTRGTGLAGLCGIPPVRENIVRPLLFCTRAQVEAYCEEKHLAFVTDSTNFSPAYTRNRIRHEILPVLKTLNPAVLEAVTRMCTHLREENETAEAFCDTLLQNIHTNAIPLDMLKNQPKALACRVLKRVLQEKTGVELSASHIDAVYALLFKNGSVTLPNGVTARSRGGVLEFPTKTEAELFCIPFPTENFPATVCLPQGRVEIQKYTQKDLQNLHKDLLANAVDCVKIGNAVLRSRRAGDRFTHGRRAVTKSVKKWLNELGVAPEQRNVLPLLATENEILWFAGCGASKTAKPTENTKEFLVLTYICGGNTNE